jgi:hypothetical protein
MSDFIALCAVALVTLAPFAFILSAQMSADRMTAADVEDAQKARAAKAKFRALDANRMAEQRDRIARMKARNDATARRMGVKF